jgi:hypothetical protein
LRSSLLASCHRARPNLLYAVALCELLKNGVDAVANTAEQSTSFGSRISLLGRMWDQKLHTHTRQLFSGLWRMEVAISYDDPGGKLYKLRHHRELVSVGGGHRDAGDQPRPAEANVHPEAVEGLPEQRVLAEGRFPFEARAAVDASKEASRQGHRVADSKGWVVGSERKELLPKTLLDFTEVSCLPGEGGPMYLSLRAGNHSP